MVKSVEEWGHLNKKKSAFMFDFRLSLAVYFIACYQSCARHPLSTHVKHEIVIKVIGKKAAEQEPPYKTVCHDAKYVRKISFMCTFVWPSKSSTRDFL